MSLLQDLQWRYATKKFNNEAIEEAKLEVILEATRLSASSSGLQPFKVIVVTNQDIKLKLQEAAYGQAQLRDSQAVLVFAGAAEVTEAMIDDYMQNIATTRNVNIESLSGFATSIKGNVNSKTKEEQQHWAAKQAYIALGTALVAAANERVDACPMEGFVPAKFDEILGLAEHGLKSAVIMCVGLRSEEDKLADMAKVRKSKEDFFILKG